LTGVNVLSVAPPAAKRKFDIEWMTTLGLIHAADRLEPLLNAAVKNGTPPHALVDQLREAEYVGREGRQGQRRRGIVDPTLPTRRREQPSTS